MRGVRSISNCGAGVRRLIGSPPDGDGPGEPQESPRRAPGEPQESPRRAPGEPEGSPASMNLFDLTGRVALVTGGNGGIGRGLAQAGAAVAIAAHNRTKADAALAEL